MVSTEYPSESGLMCLGQQYSNGATTHSSTEVSVLSILE